ncbi:efflux RND transporter permease subunit, partial [bacterium]|nr:efflux RND transporter permease subunit [bacterium]
MSITRQAIEKNRVTMVALALVLIAGVMSYLQMSRAQDPGFIIRTATVTTIFPGASPERVEMLVTDKLEKAIQEIPELDYVKSESKTSVSIVFVNIKESYTDLQPIWDKLRRKVEKAAEELPEDVIGPTVNDEFGDVFGVVMTVTGEGYSFAELQDVAEDVRDEILLLDNVSKVDLYGTQEERIFVEYNNARLSELGLSPAQLRQILESRNIIIPGGEITSGARRVVLEPTGNFESVEDLRRSIVSLPPQPGSAGSAPAVVYLEDLATITRGYVDPPDSITRSSGVPCIALAVSMREGGNIITLGEGVRALKKRLEASYPIGVEFDLVNFQPDLVNDLVNDFVVNLLQSVAIVVAVMILSLGLRTGVLVASLIPATMLASMLFMSLFDIGLDQVSLAALIIALGMLVDNAIVMSESIMVQMGEGKSPMDAAVDSANELRIPLLTSSLTTAAAFLPIYLAESMVGEYTVSLFKVVTIALLCSWALSLTMIPLLCYRFLKVPPGAGESFDTRFYRGYRKALLWMLRRRAATIVILTVVFAVSMVGFRFIPAIFFPEAETPKLTAQLDLPMGTSILETDRVVGEFEKFLAAFRRAPDAPDDEDGVLNWVTYIGDGGPRFYQGYTPELSSPESATLVINVTTRPYADELAAKLEAFVADEFPDLEAKIRPLSNGPPVDHPVEIRVSGKENDRLFAIVDRIQAHVAETAGTRNVSNNWGAKANKLRVNIDAERARLAGVTNQDVAVSLQTMLSGLETTEYREDDKVIPVMMRSVAADREDIGKLETMSVYAQSSGASVPLKQVADIEIAWEAAKVIRRNRLRTVSVQAQLDEGVTASQIVAELRPWLEEQKASWPIGYKFEFGGEV